MGTEKWNQSTAAAAQEVQVTPQAAPTSQIQVTPPTGADAAKIAAALAKYKETIHQSTVDRLMAAKRSQLHRPDENAQIKKGNMQDSNGWIYSPGILHILAMADERLTTIARVKGVTLVNNQVARVSAELIGNDLMAVFPAPPTDLTAIEVKRFGSVATVTLSNRLIAAGVAVETGWKELRPMVLIPEGSELWPGLAIDFSLPPLKRAVAVKEKDEKDDVEEGVEDEE